MSQHAAAAALLDNWTAPDRSQEALRAEFLRHLAASPDALARGGRPDHLTASAVVLDQTADRVALVLHRKVRRWLQPGGHVEPQDESLAAAALREAVEETGIRGLVLSADPVRLDRHRAPCGARQHLDVQFLAVAPEGAEPAASHESDAVAWFAVEALPQPLGERTAELVASALRARLG